MHDMWRNDVTNITKHYNILLYSVRWEFKWTRRDSGARSSKRTICRTQLTQRRCPVFMEGKKKTHTRTAHAEKLGAIAASESRYMYGIRWEQYGGARQVALIVDPPERVYYRNGRGGRDLLPNAISRTTFVVISIRLRRTS